MQIMNNSDIPFETEADLRARGTAKTPDILLSCPVGVRVRKRNEFLSPSSMKSLPMATMNEIVIDATNPATPQPMSKTTAAAAEHDNDDDNDDDLYEWKIICWIDSKVRITSSSLALFYFDALGLDPSSHEYVHHRLYLAM